MYACCFGSPNHGYPADAGSGGYTRNRDSRTYHVACVGGPRAEVEQYSIYLFREPSIESGPSSTILAHRVSLPTTFMDHAHLILITDTVYGT